MKILLATIVLFATGTAYAQSLAPQDIVVTTSNPDYEVSSIKIRRIADDNASKLLCHKLHWFLNFYWAPREWDITLDVLETDDGEFTATANPNFHHNRTCKASLITAFTITMYDSSRDREFEYERYVYTQGNETIVFDAEVSFREGQTEESSYYGWDFRETDRYVDENENFLLIEIN